MPSTGLSSPFSEVAAVVRPLQLHPSALVSRLAWGGSTPPTPLRGPRITAPRKTSSSRWRGAACWKSAARVEPAARRRNGRRHGGCRCFAAAWTGPHEDYTCYGSHRATHVPSTREVHMVRVSSGAWSRPTNQTCPKKGRIQDLWALLQRGFGGWPQRRLTGFHRALPALV